MRRTLSYSPRVVCIGSPYVRAIPRESGSTTLIRVWPTDVQQIAPDTPQMQEKPTPVFLLDVDGVLKKGSAPLAEG